MASASTVVAALVALGRGPRRCGAGAGPEPARSSPSSRSDGRFTPTASRSSQDDLVKITLTQRGTARTASPSTPTGIDEARRRPARPITFEFRADQAGRFTFYCNLTSDAQCRDMKGTLVVARPLIARYRAREPVRVVGEERVHAERVEEVRHLGGRPSGTRPTRRES